MLLQFGRVDDARADDARELLITLGREMNGVCFEQRIVGARKRREFARRIAQKCTGRTRGRTRKFDVLPMQRNNIRKPLNMSPQQVFGLVPGDMIRWSGHQHRYRPSVMCKRRNLFEVPTISVWWHSGLALVFSLCHADAHLEHELREPHMIGDPKIAVRIA